jgi:hypothetical protein
MQIELDKKKKWDCFVPGSYGTVIYQYACFVNRFFINNTYEILTGIIWQIKSFSN